MIFGRRKNRTDESTDEVDQAETEESSAVTEESEVDEEQSEVDATEAAAESDADAAEDDEPETEPDAWAELDADATRDEGPFDIDEVDLEDDEVNRIDLGVLVLTPFPGAELRLNVRENTTDVLSALMVQGDSALEIALFAAPSSGGLWTDVRQRMVTETEAAGGRATLAEGPFGTEVRRLMPAKGPKGEQGFQPSRTWMAQGPRWALRGVLFGKAAISESLDDDPVAPFFDAFRDVVVRRGAGPQRSGEILAMTLPEGARQAPRTPSPEPPVPPTGSGQTTARAGG